MKSQSKTKLTHSTAPKPDSDEKLTPTLTLTSDDCFDADFSEQQVLMALPDEELKLTLWADLSTPGNYSDAELAEQFQLSKQVILGIADRNDRGEGKPADARLMQMLMISIRCVLTAAYRRGLQWALDEVHKTKRMATA